MKRDMELVRKILLATEEGAGVVPDFRLEIPGYEPSLVLYNVELLQEAGYITYLKTIDGVVRPQRLTWIGHEFLASVRDETVWGKVKDRLGSGLEAVTVDTLKEVAVGFAKAYFLLG